MYRTLGRQGYFNNK